MQSGCRPTAGETNRSLWPAASAAPPCRAIVAHYDGLECLHGRGWPAQCFHQIFEGLASRNIVRRGLLARAFLPAAGFSRGDGSRSLGCWAPLGRLICRSGRPGVGLLAGSALTALLIFVGIHVITPMLSDITGRGLVPRPIRIPSLWNCLCCRIFSLQLPLLKLQPLWYPGSRPGQRLFARGYGLSRALTRSYQAGPLGCAVQVRSCSSRLMTSWMNAMSSTTAKWAPSLMWTCRRELVKRPQPRACLRDT